MKGSVYQRGRSWTYRFRGPERDPSTGEYPTISKGGFRTEKEAWKACRDAMRDADRGRVMKPSTRTVAEFFEEWLTTVESVVDASTWQSWRDYARVYSFRASAVSVCKASTSRSYSSSTESFSQRGA